MQKAGAFKVINKDSAVTELYVAVQEAVAAVRPILIIEDPSSEKTSVKDPEGEPETLHRTDLLFWSKAGHRTNHNDEKF